MSNTETLSIEKFNPTKAEIQTLVASVKDLSIAGIADRAGYDRVHRARIELKTVRVTIQKTGKALREDAVAFQKAVIAKEKELVEMVEPAENILAAKQQAIDEEKEQLKRRELLPARQQKLASIDVLIADEFLLVMDDARFDEFYNQKNAENLTLREQNLRAEAERQEIERLRKEQVAAAEIEVERQKIRAEAERLNLERQELQRARDEAALEARQKVEVENARRDAEEKAKRDIEARHEAERLETERKVREAEAIRIAEQEKLEKGKKYQEFLKANGYTESNKDEFLIQREGPSVILFRRVAVLRERV